MSLGKGFGKVILFGEHFVVHDLPAIVAGLPWCTTASVHVTEHSSDAVRPDRGPKVRVEGYDGDSKKSCITLHDERPRISGVKFLAGKQRAYDQLAQNILEKMGITDGVHITLAGDLAVSSGGIGASAATSVAITRALNKLYNFKLSDHEINEIALHGERAVHGNPSGIDNTAATYGGLFVFQKNTQPRFIEQTDSLDIVLIDSGFTTPTPDVIASVRSFKEKNPELVQDLIAQYKTIVQEAELILSEKLHDNPDNLVRLGTLMNQNHTLLQQLGVSTPELDDIVSFACKSGALGAKITGTGRGGLILALTPGDIQERVAKKFITLGYNVLTATLTMSVLDDSNIKRDNIIFTP